MQPAQVLVIGCAGGSANGGFQADEKAINANKVSLTTVQAASVDTSQSDKHLHETEPSVVAREISDAISHTGCTVVKIGALFSEETIKAISEIPQQNRQLRTVVDAAAFFTTGFEMSTKEITAFRTSVLPQTNILSGTVQEMKILLEDAGIPTAEPRGVPDVKLMGNALRDLGPKYVIVNREILDVEDKATTLHCILCGPSGSSLESYRCHNPNEVSGVSYSIPAAIAASLAAGCDEPEAVAAGYSFVEKMLKDGNYFS